MQTKTCVKCKKQKKSEYKICHFKSQRDLSSVKEPKSIPKNGVNKHWKIPPLRTKKNLKEKKII